MTNIDISLSDLIERVATKALNLTSENKIHWKNEKGNKYSAKLNNQLQISIENNGNDYFASITYKFNNESISKGITKHYYENLNNTILKKLYDVAEMFCDDFTHAVIAWIDEK